MAARSGPSQHEKFNNEIVRLAQVLQDMVRRLNDQGLTEVTPNKISLVIGFLNGLKQTDPKTLIETFIKYSTEELNDDGATCWDQIHNRDEEFFEKNCQQIFRDIPLPDATKHISTFRMLFTTYYVINKAKFIVNVGDTRYNSATTIDPDYEWRIGHSPHGPMVIMPGELNYDAAEPIVSSSLRYIFNEKKFVADKNVDGAMPVLDDEEKQIIWDYFDALIRISIGYVHLKRGPSTVLDEATGKRKAVYTNKNINNKNNELYFLSPKQLTGLNKYAKLFDIKLKWK